MAEIENLKIGNGGTLHIVGNEDIVANAWQAGKTYVKNKSYVIREHRLYVCNVTHTSVEPFDATNWTEITVGEAIAANTTAIGSLSTLTTTDKSSLVGAVNEVNTKATSGAIPLQVAQGVTIAYSSVSKNDKLVTITAEVRFSGSANAWTNLATIAYPPKVVQLSVPAVNSANGSLMGILQVQNSGNIRIYPTTAQTNGACAFSISYLTA